MRIYISMDLEGIHGVDRYDSHESKNVKYQRWKAHVGQLMYEEIKAVYDALILRGITEVVVFDSHSGGDATLSLPHKFPKLTHVRRNGENKVPFPVFDSFFDGMVLWGYHVKAGSETGKLEHTSSRRIKYVKVNGKDIGEVYLHGLYAFNNGVPLIAISGDSGLRKEVKKDIGNIPFFNSNTGDRLCRNEYLEAIRNFILSLNFEDVLTANQKVHWPTKTTLEICYKNPFVNIGRWILRKQFRYARLKNPFSCIYDNGSFLEQWNQYNGFSC